MITNTGKEIIGKYLVGQTDSYASYLAIGCGPKPLAVGTAFGDYSTKTSLDFETLRVPIVSKNVLTDAGVTRITLTAELPTEERYEITEIGVYPSQNNPIPTGLDSQSLVLFDSNELWESHVSSTIVPVPLQLGTIFNSNDDINIADKVFYANSNNALFENINYPNRLARHERPRFLDRAINQTDILGNKKPKLAPKIFKNDCLINWNQPAEKVHNFIRGLSPYPAAWCILENKTKNEIKNYKITSSKITDRKTSNNSTIELNKIGLFIPCSDFYIEILELQQEGKKKMNAKEFYAGYNKFEFSTHN